MCVVLFFGVCVYVRRLVAVTRQGSEEPTTWNSLKRMCIARWKKGLLDRIVSKHDIEKLYEVLRKEANEEQASIAKDNPLIGRALKVQDERSDWGQAGSDQNSVSEDDVAWQDAEFPRPQKRVLTDGPRALAIADRKTDEEKKNVQRDLDADFEASRSMRAATPDDCKKKCSHTESECEGESTNSERSLANVGGPASSGTPAETLKDAAPKTEPRPLADKPDVVLPWLSDIGVKERDLRVVSEFFMSESVETHGELLEVIAIGIDVSTSDRWTTLPLLAQVTLKKYIQQASAI